MYIKVVSIYFEIKYMIKFQNETIVYKVNQASLLIDYIPAVRNRLMR